jgi:hypothetical protein
MKMVKREERSNNDEFEKFRHEKGFRTFLATKEERKRFCWGKIFNYKHL